MSAKYDPAYKLQICKTLESVTAMLPKLKTLHEVIEFWLASDELQPRL